MKRFILDTVIAGLYLDRKRGVFERAEAEVARGNRVGIAAPVLGELAFRAEGSPLRDRNMLRLRQTLDVWKLWLVDTAASFEYGRIAFDLKTIGRPIGQNDKSNKGNKLGVTYQIRELSRFAMLFKNSPAFERISCGFSAAQRPSISGS